MFADVSLTNLSRRQHSKREWECRVDVGGLQRTWRQVSAGRKVCNATLGSDRGAAGVQQE